MAANGLNKITEKILQEAQAEADRIRAEAESDCERIRNEYAERAAQIRERLSAQAEQKGADLITRAKSSAAMQKRNLIQQKRSDLLENVFVDARKWVLALPEEKYCDLLAGLLSSALLEQTDTEEKNRALYGDEDEITPEVYEVLFNKNDRERVGAAVLERTRKKLGGKLSAERLAKLRLSDKTVAMDGGVILRYGDVETNCSFEMLFSQLHRDLEAEVSRNLFGAKGQN